MISVIRQKKEFPIERYLSLLSSTKIGGGVVFWPAEPKFSGWAKNTDGLFWNPKVPEPYLIFYIYYAELIRMLSKLIGVARVVTCVDGPRRLKSSRNVTAGGLVFRTPFFSSEVLLWEVS